MISKISMKVPYMISVGNHEYGLFCICNILIDWGDKYKYNTDHTSKSTSPDGNDVSGVGGTGYHPSWGNMGDDSYGIYCIYIICTNNLYT